MGLKVKELVNVLTPLVNVIPEPTSEGVKLLITEKAYRDLKIAFNSMELVALMREDKLCDRAEDLFKAATCYLNFLADLIENDVAYKAMTEADGAMEFITHQVLSTCALLESVVNDDVV